MVLPQICYSKNGNESTGDGSSTIDDNSDGIDVDKHYAVPSLLTNGECQERRRKNMQVVGSSVIRLYK